MKISVLSTCKLRDPAPPNFQGARPPRRPFLSAQAEHRRDLHLCHAPERAPRLLGGFLSLSARAPRSLPREADAPPPARPKLSPSSCSATITTATSVRPTRPRTACFERVFDQSKLGGDLSAKSGLAPNFSISRASVASNLLPACLARAEPHRARRSLARPSQLQQARPPGGDVATHPCRPAYFAEIKFLNHLPRRPVAGQVSLMWGVAGFVIAVGLLGRNRLEADSIANGLCYDFVGQEGVAMAPIAAPRSCNPNPQQRRREECCSPRRTPSRCCLS